jgi:hypothetical protein
MSNAWSSVWDEFTALHCDIANPRDVHEHTWRVEVFWPSHQVQDKRTRAYHVREELAALEGKRLPDSLARAEDLAAHFVSEFVAISVRVSREDERHAATCTLDAKEYEKAWRRNQGRR